MKKIFLLGSSGFVGKNVYKYLSSEYSIYCFNYLTGDLSNELYKFNPDIIINSAGETSESDKMFDANILLVYQILNFCKNNKHVKFIHIGSGKEYQLQNSLLNENSVLRPKDIYESSKCSGSMLCIGYAAYYKLPIIVIRPFSIFGQYQNKNTLIYKLIDASIKGGNVDVYDGKNDFIYIKDVIRGIKLFCEIANKSIIGGDIVNFCSGTAYSNKDVVKIITDIFGNNANINYINFIQNKFCIGDPSYCKNVYGFSTEFNLKTGLTDFKKQLKI